MQIATYNVNGVNRRLGNLLEWLQEAAPDIVCLQELKAPDDKFPAAALHAAGYGAVWHGQKSWNGVAILARGAEPVETGRGLPGDPDDTHSRYIEAAIGGIIVGCLYLPNGNPAPGPKFDYAALVREADGLRRSAPGQQRAGGSGRRLQRDADRARRLCAGALGRRRPVQAGGARGLSPPGRAGLDRRAADAASRRADLHLLEIFAGTPLPATPDCASITCC
jgi:Endonuclease/Exonuclease/phosphatase family